VNHFLAWALLAYLCGSIPVGLVIGRLRGRDLRREGSGNIGATNAGRVLGKRYGLVCLLLDVAMGAGPVLGAGGALGWAGTFDLAAMEEMETPGVTLFMQLPGPEQPLDAFEDMLAVARDLAAEMGADLKDEQHSVMTPQTIEHCRQRIREFTRRQMSRRS
jgi:hypothetical protein